METNLSNTSQTPNLTPEPQENEDKNPEEEENFNCPECQCTYLETGKSISVQHFYKCETCFPDSKIRLICASCAAKCHKGHLLIDAGVLSGYCDCGSGSLPAETKCKRMLTFTKKYSLVKIAKSRRDNFRFITTHVCWSGKGEVVEVNIKRIRPTNDNNLLEDGEIIEEEEKNEKNEKFDEKNVSQKTEDKSIQFSASLDLSIPIDSIIQKNEMKSQTSYANRKITFSKSKDFLIEPNYNQRYIQSARRMNRKSSPPRRASQTWKRPEPRNDGRFVVFINPKKKEVTASVHG